MEAKTKRRRRGPVTLTVRRLNEAAGTASRCGFTVSEFLAAALWAADLNLLEDDLVNGSTNREHLASVSGLVERRMKGER